jgi:hypothetical protein
MTIDGTSGQIGSEKVAIPSPRPSPRSRPLAASRGRTRLSGDTRPGRTWLLKFHQIQLSRQRFTGSDLPKCPKWLMDHI